MKPMDETILWRDGVSPRDVENVRGICESTGFFNDEEIGVAVELVQERLAKGHPSGYEFLFAETREGVIGYACYGPIAGTMNSYDLYWIVVDDRLRGQGLGSTIMRETERRIAASGGRRVYVETSGRDQYLPTRKFYIARGYREEAVLEDFYAPGDAKVILVKNL